MAKITKKIDTLKIASRAIHAGGYPDPLSGAIIPPIYQTSTYAQKSPGKHQGYEYSRSHNPTRTRLEECLASLESARYALSTASGMSAAMLIMHFLPKGSTVICGNDVYGGTYRMFTTVFNKDFEFIFTNTSKTNETKKLIKQHKPSLLWLESPSNPLFFISDIAQLTATAKKYKTLTLVDNTFATPYFQLPLKLGAEIVLHSTSKYLNGHSDIIGGAIMLNSKKIYDQLWTLQNSIGPSQSPFDSWLVLRGVKTLAIRMEKHHENAMEIATFLDKHPKIEQVIYPGLKNHPQHNLAKKQMSGFGGMMSCYLKGGLRPTQKFLSSLEIFTLAESLGGIESLVEHPGIMTHSSIPKKLREKIGITNNLVRMSVGIEDAKDLTQDIKIALKKAFS